MNVIEFVRDFRLINQQRDKEQMEETARHDKAEERIYDHYLQNRINLAKKYNVPENLIP